MLERAYITADAIRDDRAIVVHGGPVEVFWTANEKQKMLDDYRRAHLARCPRDRALLTVTDVRTGESPDEEASGPLQVHCPTCRRTFSSSDIDPERRPMLN